MSYLEELLPEFRNGAKIRRKIWSDKVFMSSENIGESCLCARDIDANDWELWQEPKEDIDWDHIIKNKCLCWFWDDVDSLEESSYGYLTYHNKNILYCYNGKKWYKNCHPVRRDEVTFYEDNKDE